MTLNRREAQRTPIIVDIRVENEANQQWLTRTRNVSETGAFLFSTQKESVRQGESIVLKVQSSSLKARSVPAEVVHLDSLGVGIRFTDRS